MEGKEHVCPMEIRTAATRAAHAMGELAALYADAREKGEDVRDITRTSLFLLQDTLNNTRHSIFATEGRIRQQAAHDTGASGQIDA